MGRGLVYPVVVRAFRVLFVLLGLRIEVRGAERIPPSGPAVLVCNHTSYLDFALVGDAARRQGRLVRFLAKKSTFDSPLSGGLMRAMGHVPVDRARGASAYRRARRTLGQGELVGVFPEATISRSWTLKPFKPGAAAMAVAEQVPLVPMVLWGAHRVLTVDGHWSLRRGRPVTVLVGEPIVPGPGGDADQVGRLLRERMSALLESAQRDYPDAPAGERDRWWLPRHLGGTAPTPEAAAALDAVGPAGGAPARAAAGTGRTPGQAGGATR